MVSLGLAAIGSPQFLSKYFKNRCLQRQKLMHILQKNMKIFLFSKRIHKKVLFCSPALAVFQEKRPEENSQIEKY